MEDESFTLSTYQKVTADELRKVAEVMRQNHLPGISGYYVYPSEEDSPAPYCRWPRIEGDEETAGIMVKEHDIHASSPEELIEQWREAGKEYEGRVVIAEDEEVHIGNRHSGIRHYEAMQGMGGYISERTSSTPKAAAASKQKQKRRKRAKMARKARKRRK